MATYQQSITALVDGLKTLFENRTCTEAQAIANASSKPNTIYYTTDTKCVVVGGQIYGRGQQLSSVFRFIPAGETPGQGEFSDTGVIYVQPDGTNFVLWWYQPSGTWVHTGSIAFDIATSASDISYDLTPTPDLGGGDVQSAIEALDGKVEAVDARIDDEKVEFIKERFPSKNVSNYTRHTVNYKFEWVNGQAVYTANTSYRVGYYSKLVPKGSFCQLSLYYTSAPSTWGGLSMWGYSTTNIDDYIAENGSIVGLPTIRIKHIHGNGWIRDALFIMPEDGYLICAYQNTYSPTLGTSLIYDVNDLTDLYTEYYKKGVADGSGMASIAGLGYNIFDHISGSVNMEGFEYGCELYRQYYPQFTGNIQNKFNGNTKIVYCPKFDFSVATASAGSLSVFRNATHLVVVPDLDYGSRSVSLAYSFDGCTNLVYVGDFKNCIISYVQQLFRNCSKLLHIGKMDWSSGGQYTFQGCTSLQRIEEINLEHLANSEGSFALTSQYNIFGVNAANSTLRYVVFKNFGMKSAHVGPFQFNYISNWGVATAAQPDALQSLILTWNDYLFDRAGANETAKQAAIDAGTYDESTWTDPYPVCTVRFSGTVKNLLNTTTVNEQTLTEIITSKGYTIV